MNQARSRVPRIAEAAVERARLTVVPRAAARRAARVPFVVLVSLLLVGGVAGLLCFNTSMQQASFTATAMEDQAQALDAQQQSLTMELDALRDPQRVAARAQQMGMVPREQPRVPPALRRQGARQGDPGGDRRTRCGSPRCRPASRRTCGPPRSSSRPSRAQRARLPTARPPRRGAPLLVPRRPRTASTSRGASVDPRPSPPPAPAGARAASAAVARGCGRCAGASLVRLRIGFLLIAMVVSVFAARLFQLQGIDAQAYVAKAPSEGVVTVTLPANRGTITDRNGVPLAESVDGLMIVADPSLTVKNASEIATILARRLDLDYFDLLAKLRKPGTQFQYIARRVPSTKAKAVVADHRRARLQGDRHPSRPGADLPRRGRRGQPRRLHERQRRRRRGRRADVRHDAVRQGRLRDLRDRRRQPDPARRQQHGAAQERARPAA